MTPETGDAALPDARLLRLFDLLYATHSVTRAAEQLGQTQPTVSIWLAALRRKLGDPLFVRTSAGMRPTPRADALIGSARQALDSLRQLAAKPAEFEPATAERTFRVCMTDGNHITLLPRLLARVRALAPRVRLAAATIGADIAETLQSGEADLALGLIPALEAGFYQQSLFSQDWVCLASARHPRVKQKLSLRQYRSEGHIHITQGTGQHLIARALAKHGIDRRIVLELPGFLGITITLATTDLIVTLPRNIGETLADLGHLRIYDSPIRIPSFMVKQHWHSRYHDDPGNRWLRGLCAKLFLEDRSLRVK
jgi:DNA-binding transcriptional LysR family regulator